jgi:hypothetical protein
LHDLGDCLTHGHYPYHPVIPAQKIKNACRLLSKGQHKKNLPWGRKYFFKNVTFLKIFVVPARKDRPPFLALYRDQKRMHSGESNVPHLFKKCTVVSYTLLFITQRLSSSKMMLPLRLIRVFLNKSFAVFSGKRLKKLTISL